MRSWKQESFFIKPTILLLLAMSFLAGCNTMSQKECQQGNWYEVGLGDGTNGYSLDRLDDHRKSCSEYGGAIDRQAYLRGRTEGLKQFCTRANGYQRGNDGREYHDVCPAQLKLGFLEGYQAGLEDALGRARQALRHARRNQHDQQRHSKKDQDRKQKESKSDKYERERLQREVKKLQQLLDKADFLRGQTGRR